MDILLKDYNFFVCELSIFDLFQAEIEKSPDVKSEKIKTFVKFYFLVIFESFFAGR